MPDPAVRFVSKTDAIAIVQAAKLAYTNQNAIGKVKIGNDTFTAAEAVDQIELVAGTNVGISISGDTITISATDTTYGAATPDTYVEGTKTADGTAGLMTGADKYKLNNIDAGAEVNVLEEVKVNGTALTATDKAVNITVTTGDTTVGNIKVNGANVTPYGLGTAAGATVETTGISSNTTTLATTAQVKTYVDATVTSAYKASGSLAANAVTSSLLVASNEGNVYNLSGDLTLDSTSAALFVDGTSGDVIVAGTNIAVVNAGSNAYKFDKMAGFIDVSDFLTEDDFGGLSDDDLAEVLAEL